MNKQQIQDTISMMADPVVRQKYLDDPKAAYAEMQSQGHPLSELSGNEEFKVVTNTADTMYIVFPEISNAHALDENHLAQIQAAGSGASTIACAGSASTVGTANTTLSTGGSAGSASTAGSA